METRTRILATLVSNAQSNVERHLMNVEVLLNNPVGVGEHPDIMETIEGEIDKMEKYISRRNILQGLMPQPEEPVSGEDA